MSAVGFVEGLASAQSGGLAELVERLGDEGGGSGPWRARKLREELGLDVPVVVAFVPVAEEGVAEVVPKMADGRGVGSLSQARQQPSSGGSWGRGGGLGSGLVAESSSTFQWPPLSGPTRATFPAVRQFVQPVSDGGLGRFREWRRFSRRLAEGFSRRRARMRSASGRSSGGWSSFSGGFSGGFLAVFWSFAGRGPTVSRLATGGPPSQASVSSVSSAS